MSDNSTTYNGEIVMVNVAPDDNDAHKKDLSLTNSFDLLNDLENVTDGEALVEVVHASLDSTNLDVGVAKSVSSTVTHSLDASLIIAPNMVLNVGLSDKNNIVVQHPMPQPITTAYTSLTSDKRPISTIVGKQTTNIHSEASLKIVQILKKFWGDVDDDVEDSAFDSLQEAEINVSKYLAHKVELGNLPRTNRKAQRQKKEKANASKISDNPKKQNKHIKQAYPADSMDSEGIITRSKKGISKPKVLEP